MLIGRLAGIAFIADGAWLLFKYAS
jgi:hypothetical protein